MKSILGRVALGVILSLSACGPSLVAAPEGASADMSEAELIDLAVAYKSYMAINTELKPSDIHGNRVKTFLDPDGFKTYQDKSFPYADGTVSVKESYGSPDGSPEKLYVMKKIAGYDPDNGDWFYAVMSPEGIASQSGRISLCISCHVKAKSKDYLYGFEN